MTKAELTTLVTQEVKGLSSQLNSNDYANSINEAERDTGFSMPVTSAFQIKWMKLRTKRHLFFSLQSESAHKFQYKQMKLDHRFRHYTKLIEDMDKTFKEAQEEYAFEFAGVSASEAFGHKLDAGFAYDPQTGRDMTYDDDNQVIITPNANS